MPLLIAIVVIIVALYLIAQYWKWLLLLSVLAGVVWFSYDQAKKRAAQQAVEEAKKQRLRESQAAQKKAHDDQQKSYSEKLNSICFYSTDLYERLPVFLLAAEEQIDLAEREFADGVFAPFWDAIEAATTNLGGFYTTSEQITAQSREYAQILPAFEDAPPKLPIRQDSVNGMVVANGTDTRLKTIVRKAQTNFQFATIYEQRKTNQILVAGFTNLASALDGLGYRIAASIDSLDESISGINSQLSNMTETLHGALIDIRDEAREHHEDLVSSNGQIKGAIEQGTSSANERMDHALEMLNNIQRRRLPSDPKIGDHAY